MINPRSERAVYRQLADLLRAQLERGELGPGDRLPSEGTLQQTYGVGRETVRQALRVLRNEGLLVTESGYGTRVRSQSERKTVRVPRGAQVISRPATHSERQDEVLDLDEGEWVVEITIGGRTQAHPADRVILTFA